MRGDDGSATLVAVAAMAVLLAITLGAVCVGAAVSARHRAQAAADLGALAAAGHVGLGLDAACAHAAEVARAMHAEVARCAADGLDVVVAVEITVAVGRLDIGRAHAMARAGPAEAMR